MNNSQPLITSGFATEKFDARSGDVKFRRQPLNQGLIGSAGHGRRLQPNLDATAMLAAISGLGGAGLHMHVQNDRIPKPLAHDHLQLK